MVPETRTRKLIWIETRRSGCRWRKGWLQSARGWIGRHALIASAYMPQNRHFFSRHRVEVGPFHCRFVVQCSQLVNYSSCSAL
jgi:hypothetical protein